MNTTAPRKSLKALARQQLPGKESPAHRAPLCICGCTMPEHYGPWMPSLSKAGRCKTHTECLEYHAETSQPTIIPAKQKAPEMTPERVMQLRAAIDHVYGEVTAAVGQDSGHPLSPVVPILLAASKGLRDAASNMFNDQLGRPR